jgi:SAM-dependent methyltransferase
MPFEPTGIYSHIPWLTWQCDRQVERVLARLPPGGVVVDLGAGGRKISPRTICLDFVALPNTDVIGDVHRLPLRDASVDLVYATGLFEHVADERVLIREIERVLKVGGIVHVEVPFLEQYHEDPIDVRRLTVPGLEMAMNAGSFATLAKGAHIGPTVTLLNTTARWWALWFEGESKAAKALSFATFAGLSTLFWPLRFLDKILIRKKGAHALAMGVYYTGEKVGPSVAETAARAGPTVA